MTWLLDWLLRLGRKREKGFALYDSEDDEEDDDEEEEEWDRSLG